jgi:hypothetical protein
MFEQKQNEREHLQVKPCFLRLKKSHPEINNILMLQKMFSGLKTLEDGILGYKEGMKGSC